MAIRMRRGQLADFDPTKQLSGEFGVSIDNSAGNQKVFMAFGNGNVKELMTVEDAEAQIGELVDDKVDAAIGDIVDTVTEAAETATTAAQTATTQAGTATTKAGEAASSASSASTAATSAAGSAASADDSAEDSEAWAVGQRDGQDVPATDETYHNNAKYWADQASQAAGGGVTSFNGRSGSVSPQSGDYTAAMVGLGNVDNTSDLDKPISTATQVALDEKADESSLTDGSVTKIGTGTVGSATQPAYINGGVPTAIEAVDKVKEVRNAYGDANTLNALNTVNFTEIYNGSHTPAESTSESYMYLTGQGGDANNGGVQIAVGAYPSTNDKIFYRRYNGGSWGSWKQIYGSGVQPLVTLASGSNISTYVASLTAAGEYIVRIENSPESPYYGSGATDDIYRVIVVIPSWYVKIECLNAGLSRDDFRAEWQGYWFNGTMSSWKKVEGIQTGTPTNVHANLTNRSGLTSFVKKSGNVVNFTLFYTVSGDIAAGTDLVTLPYTPINTTLVTMTQQGIPYEAWVTNTGKLQTTWSTIQASKAAVNFYGTYLTND